MHVRNFQNEQRPKIPCFAQDFVYIDGELICYFAICLSYYQKACDEITSNES